MQKFKNTNYYYENGKLFSKTQKEKKLVNNRYKITVNGSEKRITIDEIVKIYNSKTETIDDYYKEKNSKKQSIHLPIDIYNKLEQNGLLKKPIALFLNKILTCKQYSRIELPKEYSKLKPVEISSTYIKKIGLRKGKKGKLSDIDILKDLNIITPIPYFSTYNGITKPVGFINNHPIRYIINTEETTFKSYEIPYVFDDENLNSNDLKKRDSYVELFKITDKYGLINEYKNDILKIEKKFNKKKSIYKIQQIAILKQLINEIENHDDYYYRNTTNQREEKLLNRIENKIRGLRKKYTNIKQFSTIDITCSQLRFLYIFLSNPNSVLFDNMNIYYKEELEQYSVIIGNEILKLKVDLSQPDYWNYMMKKHNIQKKSKLKKQDLMPFLASSKYYRHKTKYFGEDYPKISEFLCKINTPNKEKNIQLNKFIIELQKAEAKFVLDNVSDKLINLNVGVFSLHDQWFFQEKNIEIVKKTIDKFTTKYFEGLTNNYK